MANDPAVILRRMKTLRTRLAKASVALAALEEQRLQLYVDARACEPPITFKQIADEFGITEAAVMQKINRSSRGAA